MIRAVFWDIDGTLIDSEPLHREKLEALARAPLGDETVSGTGVAIAPHDWNELHGKGDPYVYDWICRRNLFYPLGRAEFLAQTEAYYLSRAATLEARPGAREAFQIFAAENHAQVAVSAGARPQVDANLKAFGLKMLFSLAAGDTARSKPDPEPFNVAYRSLSGRMNAAGQALAGKAHCIAIEDSAAGVEAGKRAGMITIYWKHTPAQQDSAFADYTVTDKEDFLAVVRKLAL